MNTKTMVLLQVSILSISVGNIQIVLKLQVCGVFSAKQRNFIYHVLNSIIYGLCIEADCVPELL